MNRNTELDKRDSDNRLEALEKSLQAASNSIMATTPWQQQQQQNVTKQETRYETRSYETRSERREERQQQQQSVSRETMNGGYPRSMSPVWDNYNVEHVSILNLLTLYKPGQGH